MAIPQPAAQLTRSKSSTVGPDQCPLDPVKLHVEGEVVKGFGRGSKQLGIPTANLPQQVADQCSATLANGIYFGWASISHPSFLDRMFPMVMSLGWNPYFRNEKRSAEVHLINSVNEEEASAAEQARQFLPDFYGEQMRVWVVGYLRDERNYDSMQSLIDDIHLDIRIALNSLQRPSYEQFKQQLISP